MPSCTTRAPCAGVWRWAPALLAAGLWAVLPAPLAAEPPQSAESACGQWMSQAVGVPPPPPQAAAELLLTSSAAPPDEFCPLRALYLAADLAPEKAEEHLGRGLARALGLLARRPGWRGVSREQAAKRAEEAGPEEAAPLFWVGYFWIHQLSHKSRWRAAMEIGDAVAILERASALAPALYAGAADAVLGGYYAALPRFFGRDFKLSRAHFERSLAHAQGNLARRWTYARSFLQVAQPAAHWTLIEEIAAAPLDPAAPYYLESHFAQRDARALLEKRGRGGTGASERP